MIEYSLSADQVRAGAGCTFAEAQFAVYMASASQDRTLARFAEMTGHGRDACRQAAFRWGVQFEDYDPFGKPKRLDWRKVAKGWDLLDGEEVIGECRREPSGKYCARLFSATSAENWDARRAMTAIAQLLDAQSPDLPGFDGKPLKVVLSNKSGLVEDVLFPAEGEDVQKCRDALQYRTMRVAA